MAASASNNDATRVAFGPSSIFSVVSSRRSASRRLKLRPADHAASSSVSASSSFASRASPAIFTTAAAICSIIRSKVVALLHGAISAAAACSPPPARVMPCRNGGVAHHDVDQLLHAPEERLLHVGHARTWRRWPSRGAASAGTARRQGGEQVVLDLVVEKTLQEIAEIAAGGVVGRAGHLAQVQLGAGRAPACPSGRRRPRRGWAR